MTSNPSVNFAYLAHHDARLVALATQAGEALASDPMTSIAKLRLFAEVLAKAFRGELVPQDPNHKPAVELFSQVTPTNGATESGGPTRASKARTSRASDEVQ